MFISRHTLKWTKTCRSSGDFPHAHTAHFLLNRHKSRASRPWSAGAANTVPAGPRPCARGPRAGRGARDPVRSPSRRASRSSPRRSPTSGRRSRTWKKCAPCGRGSREARAKRHRAIARRAGTPARPLAEGQRVGSVHVLPSPVSSGACDASRPRTADRGGLGQDRQRVRAPADPHVPGPRVRAEGVGQDRAQGHAPHGAQVPDTGGEPLEEVQLVQGRGRRTGAELCFVKFLWAVSAFLLVRWGWCRFVGLVVDSITTNHATRPSSRRRSMMLMPNSVLIRLSRYQTM